MAPEGPRVRRVAKWAVAGCVAAACGPSCDRSESASVPRNAHKPPPQATAPASQRNAPSALWPGPVEAVVADYMAFGRAWTVIVFADGHALLKRRHTPDKAFTVEAA